MPCYRARDISLGAFAGVFPVNAADIAAANRGRLCLDKHLAIPGCWNIKLPYLHRAVSRQYCAFHLSLNAHDYTSFLRPCQDLLILIRNSLGFSPAAEKCCIIEAMRGIGFCLQVSSCFSGGPVFLPAYKRHNIGDDSMLQFNYTSARFLFI